MTMVFSGELGNDGVLDSRESGDENSESGAEATEDSGLEEIGSMTAACG